MVSLRRTLFAVVVAEEGQMTRAAERLRVAQPSLSRAIGEIESELGVAIFDRHPRGVTLTEAGERYIERARRLVSAAEQLEDLTAEMSEGPDARALRWGFPGLVPMQNAAAIYTAFAALCPDTRLAFIELGLPTAPVSGWLADADVALGFMLSVEPGIEQLAVRSERRVLMVTRSHRLAGAGEVELADVLDEVFCGGHPSLDRRRESFLTLDDHRGGPARKSHHHPRRAQERLAIIASGQAVGVGSESSAAAIVQALPDLLALPILDADPGEVHLIWRSESSNGAVALLRSIAEDSGAS